jgi:polysaccharide biosynthesis transport protein
VEGNGRAIRAQQQANTNAFGQGLEWNPRAIENGDSMLTWEQVVRILRNRKWLLLFVIGGLTLAVVTAALLMRNVYSPTARLEIDPQEGGIKTLQEIENPGNGYDLDYIDTQVQILQSESLAMRVIRTLRLSQNPEFVSKKDISKNHTEAKTPYANLSASLTQEAYLQEQLDLADRPSPEATALRAFRSKLAVNPIRDSRLVEVSFASHDPKLAQEICNSLVTQYIEQHYRNRYVATMVASDWLSSQLGDLRRKVSESNRAVVHYQKQYGLIESDDRDVPLGQLMAEVSRQLSDAEADRIQAEASVRMIDTGHWDTLPALRDNQVYQILETHYADVRGQLAQARAVYGDENVNVKKLQSESDELESQLTAERERIITRLRNTFSAAKMREKMMTESREKIREQMGDASSHLVEYSMLKSEALATVALYNTLQARLKEAGIYAGLRSGNIRVVDLAPKLELPTGPHRGLIIFVGVMLSTIFALTLAFVLESLDNTVRTPDDIRDWTQLPSLTILPRAIGRETSENRLLSDTSHSVTKDGLLEDMNDVGPKVFWYKTETAEAEAVRSLRTAIVNPTSGSTPKVILVCSGSKGEGKTTCAINLASVLAQQARSCLIEGDLRHPMIETALGLNPTVGLREVLSRQVAVEKALMTVDSVPGLEVLPVKSRHENPSDVLASSQMKKLIKDLSRDFTYVVIDSPPIIPFSDARELALLSDTVILVSRYGRTTRREILRSIELLYAVRAPLLGIVLNDMDLTSADYHYFNYGYRWAVTKGTDENAYRWTIPEKAKDAHAG